MPGVDISQVPLRVAEALNISVFAAQMLVCSILVCLFLFPALFLFKGKNIGSGGQGFAAVTVIFLVVLTEIAIGWLPIYALAVLTLLIALFFGGSILRVFRGR